MHSLKDNAAYLDLIDGASEEKAGLCAHLAGLGQRDVIVEIGPGGGGVVREVLERLKTMDPKGRPDLIVVDLNEQPLNRAKRMADSINDDLPKESQINVQTLQTDAKHLSAIKDGSVAIVNTSAIIHEIFSYSGGDEGVNEFIKELSRIIKPGGIVVYRDPDGVPLGEKATTFFPEPMLRAFIASFMRKYFLEEDGTKSERPNSRYLKDLRISLDGVKTDVSDITIAEAISTPTFLISGLSGIMHEIKRHYVVFMTEMFPEVFRSVENTPEKDKVVCRFSRNSGADVFKSYCVENKIDLEEGEDVRTFTLRKNDFARFDAFTRARFFSIFGETEINCSTDDGLKLGSFFTGKGVPYKLMASEEGAKASVLFEHLVLAYDALESYAVAEGMNLRIKKLVTQACNWFNREGRESYFYGDAIDVIVRFVEQSLTRDRATSAVGYSCFVPISPELVKFFEREHYAKYVKDCVIDFEGKYNDGKRNIHFIKRPMEETFGVLFSLYQRNNDERLRRLLDHLLELTKKSLDTPKSHREKLTAEEELFREQTNDICLVGITGGIAAGKASVGDILAAYGFTIFELSSLIRRELENVGVPRPKKSDYFAIANSLRRSNGRDYLARRAVETFAEKMNRKTVISGLRTPEEVDFLKARFRNFVLVAIDAPRELRVERVKKRSGNVEKLTDDDILAAMDREMDDPDNGGCRLVRTFEMADIRINNDLNDLEALKKICLVLLDKII